MPDFQRQAQLCEPLHLCAAVEGWLWGLSKDADFEPILTQFAGMLHSVIALFEGIPMSLHEQIHWFDSHQDLAIKFDYYFPTEKLKDDEQVVRVEIQDLTSQDSSDNDMPDTTSQYTGRADLSDRCAEPAEHDSEAGWTKVSDLLRTSIMKEKGATLNNIRSVVRQAALRT